LWQEAVTRSVVPDEWVKEILFLSLKRARGEPLGHAQYINMTPRRLSHNANPIFVVSRVQRGTEDAARRWGYNGGKVDALRFSPDKDVILHAIGVFGSVRAGAPDYTARLEVFQDDIQLYAKQYTYSAASPTIHYLDFEKPLGLKANENYQVELILNGHVSYAIGGGVSQVTTEGVTFRFLDPELGDGKQTNHTDISRGQMPAFKFQLPIGSLR